MSKSDVALYSIGGLFIPLFPFLVGTDFRNGILLNFTGPVVVQELM